MALACWEFEVLMQPGEVVTAADVLAARPAWMARAACRGHDQRAFFHSRDEVTDEARAVCADCPVRGPCLSYALAEDLEGCWGGTSKRERRAMRREAS